MWDRFAITAPVLAAALGRLEAEDALMVPLLDGGQCAALLAASRDLSYRPARPMVGSDRRPVRQDFELSMNFAPPTPFHDLAEGLSALTSAALDLMAPRPLEGRFHYNDLIVQRYDPGSAGITAHRDHIRYEGLVALVILGGEARFQVCQDRGGTAAREIPSPPGSLVLMRAPGFVGSRVRPFHLLRDIASPRVSFGLRYDTRAGEPVD